MYALEILKVLLTECQTCYKGIYNFTEENFKKVINKPGENLNNSNNHWFLYSFQ